MANPWDNDPVVGQAPATDAPAVDAPWAQDAPADNTTPDAPLPGFSDEQKQQILAYVPKAKDAADLERFASGLTGGRSHIGNAQDIIAARDQGHRQFSWLPPTPRPPPGIAQQFIDNTKNDVAGIAQGAVALPDMAATAAGKVLSVVPTAVGSGLDALGFHDAADTAHGIAHDIANPPRIGDVIEGIAPTPDTTSGKVNRFAGQMVGGVVGMPASAMENAASRIVGEVPKGFVSSVPKAVPNAAEVAKAAQTLKIDLPRFVVGGAKDARRASALEQTIGGAKPIADATGRMLDQGEAARGVIAAGVGNPSEGAAMGDAALDAAVKANKGRRQAIGTLYRAAEAQTDGATIPPTQSVATVNDLLGVESGKIGGSKIAPILSDIQSDLAKSGRITVQQARDLRTTLRERLTAEAGATPSNADRITNQVMAAVNSDIENGLKAAGKMDQFNIYKQADTAWAQQRALEDDVLKPFLGKNFDNWGEEVAAKINADAKGKGTRLARFLASLPEEDANNVRASLINRLGTAGSGAQNASGDAFSLDTFLTNWNQLKGARKMIFSAETSQALDNLAKVAEAAKAAGRTKNRSNTGSVVSYLMSGAPVTGGAAETLMTGDPKGVALGMLFSAMNTVRQYGAAKLLASPEFARKLAATPLNPKVAQAFWSRPWVKAMAVRNPAIAAELQAFQYSVLNHMNDNSGIVSSAVASPNPDQQDQQQQAQP